MATIGENFLVGIFCTVLGTILLIYFIVSNLEDSGLAMVGPIIGLVLGFFLLCVGIMHLIVSIFQKVRKKRAENVQ
jgi:putative effector of murein hydrolase LrgA (UPF0299 family)